MARTFDEIDATLSAWLEAQPLYFVATAPSGADGHVNLSPKGYDSLRVLGPKHVAYLDLTGSGAETIAHLRENGRITVMACAFDGPPRIVRLYGRGEVIPLDDDRFAALAEHFPSLPGARAVINVDVERISSSCGFGVPLMDLVGDRSRLADWADKKGPDGLADYRTDKNTESIDGLPAYPT
ncbi:pyridoxamine 5'-phosphate oxidase family protein [soil metagenome]